MVIKIMVMRCIRKLKKAFSGEPGEGRGLTFKEQLEKFKREYNAEMGKKKGHDRDKEL